MFSRLHAWLLLIAPFTLLAPVWMTGKALFWGVVSLQFVPWRYYAWEILRSGQLPLWNDLSGMGAPLLANYQSALLYPPNWLFFLFLELGGLDWGAWSLTIIGAAHLAWACVGMALLARSQGIDKLGQTVSGLAFGLSGYLVARLSFLSINATVAWMPWVILGVEQIVTRQVVKSESGNGVGNIWRLIYQWRGLVASLAMMLLAGHAQTSWYTLVLAVMWSGIRAWQHATSRRSNQQGRQLLTGSKHRLRSVIATWLQLGGAVLFSIGIAAIQLFPTAEYLLASSRAARVDYDFAMTYSLWPWRFLTLLAPDMFGNPAKGNYWGYGNFWEDAIYLGVLPLILGITALVKKHRLSGYLFTLVILAFLLALGNNTPIFPWLYRAVPTFSMFQAPTRISIWAIFALALLAGMGVNGWRRPIGKGLYWTRLATAGGFAISLGAGLAWYFFGDVKITFLRASALTGMWALGTGVLALLAPCKEPPERESTLLRRLWPWGVTFVVAADLLVAAWGLNPGIDRDFYLHSINSSEQMDESFNEGRLYVPPKVEDSLKYERFMRFDTFDPGVEWKLLRESLLPNLNILDGISSVNNFDPLTPGDYQQTMHALELGSEHVKDELLNLMGVSVVEEVDFGENGRVFFKRLPTTQRVRLVPCGLSVLDTEEAIRTILSGKLDLDRQATIQQGEAEYTADQECAQSIMKSKIQIVSESPNRIVLQVESNHDGWLVLSDTWYPGWQAYLDGVRVNIRKANATFRGTWLPQGSHSLEYVYQPSSFYLGAMISITSMLLYVFVIRKWR